jgi:fluoroacetyl-CoA thioesterase
MELKLEAGIKARVELTVAYKDTAKAVASGLAEVFATPSMIALMENAAYTAVQPYLPEGTSTVGIRIDAKHLAATPVGLKVWAEAVLADVDGRKLTFDIAAYDEVEKIGEARHERFVIDEQKFLSRAEAKGKR